MKPRQVILVPHTHWDREWYFTTRQSKVLLLESLAVVLEELESGSLPSFVLDGQTSLLEDYLEMAPQDEQRLRDLVEQGKLLIGPWYSQTDQCVVGSESILRNLLYGVRDARRFGDHLQIGYVPDSFGQTEQLPQILRQFGLGRCVFWRGWWNGICPQTEFNWASRDGSTVSTAVIQSGYSGVKGMPSDDGLHDFRMKQIRSHVETLEQRNVSDTTLVMAGNDQQPWDPRLAAILEEENQRQDDYHYRFGRMEDLFEATEDEPGLQTVTAEMLAGKFSRIHRGIYSTRYDIKKANADAENLITNVLEPILSIGWSLGFSWPSGLLEKCWKLLLKSHPHDSIGCCNSDEVNAAVKERLVRAYQMADQQLQLRMRQIAERIQASQPGDAVVLFNPLPESRCEPVDLEFVLETADPGAIRLRDAKGEAIHFDPVSQEAVRLSELVQDLGAALKPGQTGDPVLYRHRIMTRPLTLPPLGYRSLFVTTTESKGDDSVAGVIASDVESSDACRIENQRLRLDWDKSTGLSLTDLETGHVFNGFLDFENGGDDGDNYDFSPPRDDCLLSTRDHAPVASRAVVGGKQVLELKWVLPVPADLPSRADGTTNAQLPITAKLSLQPDSEWLDVSVHVDNRVIDHRLQAVLHTGLESPWSWADQPFGMIRRPIDPPELAEWEDGWTSKPLPLYPMQSTVATTDGEQGLAVITDGIREYESDPKTPGRMAITLYRCVGFMGKPDLVYRPGRLSGMPTPTPDSQLQGELDFRFAILPFAGPASQVARAARRYLSPIKHFQASEYNKFSINRGPRDLPPDYSLAEVNSGLPVSAIKKAEDQDQLVIRLFNPGLEPAQLGELSFYGREDVRLQFADMNEQPRSTPDDLLVHSQEAVTLLADLEARPE